MGLEAIKLLFLLFASFAGSAFAIAGCAAGTTAVDDEAEATCVKTGCSGQICADRRMVSTCEFRPEFACFRSATCERQENGPCGWARTPALTACLANP
jgi:eight-cysteine-cluster-containing protein